MKQLNKVSYLVGNEKITFQSTLPYNTLVCEFISTFSNYLNKDKKTKNFPDLKTLAFWCRKKNIDILKSRFESTELRVGLGLVFHITPSNIPTNFIYSLIFGLLTGNTNIVKVPSQNFEQVEIICNNINKILTIKKFTEIKNMVKVIRYSQNNEFTEKLSLVCDARMVWGGNKTIKKIREFKLQERSLDIAFTDRFSFCVINSKDILKLKKYNLNRLFEKFYNDTYLVDQNACSSPHLILWLGDKSSKAKNIFWNGLVNYVSKKYKLPEIGSMDKRTKLYEDLATINNIKSHMVFNKFLYLIRLKKLDHDLCSLRGRWGYFYELDINNLNEIAKYIKKNCQTLSYFGLSKNYLSEFILSNNLSGIDRIAPIGQALDMNFNWDGYDINKILTRIIELR